TISTQVSGSQLSVTVNGITTTYDQSAVASLTINAGAGNDQVTILSTAPGKPVTVNGEDGSDTLAGPNSTNTRSISSLSGGNIFNSSGALVFSSIENVTGGSGTDRFAFHSPGNISGTVNGGAGSNILDYSAAPTFTGPITVNLAAGTATGTGGFSNIQE